MFECFIYMINLTRRKKTKLTRRFQFIQWLWLSINFIDVEEQEKDD